MYCPNCKEEIDNDSYFCDQCGQKLSFCSSCGVVGLGRRCTVCGGEMKVRADLESVINTTVRPASNEILTPTPLMLVNDSLNIKILAEHNGILGRRNGKWADLLAPFGYISGTHAQLIYTSSEGWCIVDKNSTNGTTINKQHLTQEVPAHIKDGDIISLANVNFIVREP